MNRHKYAAILIIHSKWSHFQTIHAENIFAETVQCTKPSFILYEFIKFIENQILKSFYIAILLSMIGNIIQIFINNWINSLVTVARSLKRITETFISILSKVQIFIELLYTATSAFCKATSFFSFYFIFAYQYHFQWFPKRIDFSASLVFLPEYFWIISIRTGGRTWWGQWVWWRQCWRW